MRDVGGSSEQVLICHAGAWRCALPVKQIIETMRPLPITPLIGAPAAVLGVSLVRGAPVPVVDLAVVLGAPAARVARFISLTIGPRLAVLAVTDVVGVRALGAESLQALPPLLGDEAASVVSSLGRHDEALLLVLRDARLVPPAAWDAMEAHS
ncbi:MAG: chemotaxis protein CheW [Archangium sp.]|nr:chemotaxis protein CheW [Archangium sp.]